MIHVSHPCQYGCDFAQLSAWCTPRQAIITRVWPVCDVGTA
ncbi:hypothetical protein THTE_2799 [Thermogutta terrifontis]|uniref:Uncharacterized protein n=1 Tax=Thermogutta terrifontis TaxID=1331910 RepID=A0A286RHF6_9BACT|nr:hypothetical protein THTE_2799 [Thermogutta terrifontis]